LTVRPLPARQSHPRLAAVSIAASIGFLLALIALTFRPVVEGDGVGYYAYLHAVLVSHSLAFTSEYSAAVGSHVPLYLPLVSTRTPTGNLADYFPIGPAVLAAPAFLVALVLQRSGEPQYGSPFVDAFTVASLFYGLIALAICYRLAVSVTASRRAAAGGVIGAALATPFVYYLLSDPSYSHSFSVFCVSAFLYLWWKHPPQTSKGWFGLGLLGGLMAMTRFQDGLLMAIVLVDVKRLRWPALLLGVGAIVGFAPQLVVDHIQFGGWLPERPPGQALDPLHGHYLEALFSSRDGLFVWTPAALFAAIGFIFIRDRRLKVAFAIAFVLEAVIIGSVPDTAGRSFGSRRFLDLVPFAVLGLAALGDRIGSRLDWALVGALVTWNIVLEANFEYVMGSTQGSGLAAMLLGQGTALSYVPRLFAKGAVIRDLVLWQQAHGHFDPIGGLTLLGLEAACLAAAVAATRWPPYGPSRADRMLVLQA
jgi:hypothetical protein